MKSVISKYAARLLPITLLATVSVAHASRASRLAEFQKFAGAPIAKFTYFRLANFETLADHTVAVWTGANKVYLIQVRPPCPDFEYAESISLDSSPTNQFTQKFSTVRFGKDTCMVKSIRPVDYRAMRKAARKAEDQPD